MCVCIRECVHESVCVYVPVCECVHAYMCVCMRVHVCVHGWVCKCCFCYCKAPCASTLCGRWALLKFLLLLIIIIIIIALLFRRKWGTFLIPHFKHAEDLRDLKGQSLALLTSCNDDVSPAARTVCDRSG